METSLIICLYLAGYHSIKSDTILQQRLQTHKCFYWKRGVIHAVSISSPGLEASGSDPDLFHPQDLRGTIETGSHETLTLFMNRPVRSEDEKAQTVLQKLLCTDSVLTNT